MILPSYTHFLFFPSFFKSTFGLFWVVSPPFFSYNGYSSCESLFWKLHFDFIIQTVGLDPLRAPRELGTAPASGCRPLTQAAQSLSSRGHFTSLLFPPASELMSEATPALPNTAAAS